MPEHIDLSLLDPILNEWQSQEGALITILQETQRLYGFLPEAALFRVSREVKIPLSRVYGVVTFYSQFYLTPRGRNMVRVCVGTACHVRGSDFIMRTLEDKLGIEVGQTTEDFQFSLERVACVGTCFLAPVMMVNLDYYGKVDPLKAQVVADRYAQPEKQLQ